MGQYLTLLNTKSRPFRAGFLALFYYNLLTAVLSLSVSLV